MYCICQQTENTKIIVEVLEKKSDFQKQIASYIRNKYPNFVSVANYDIDALATDSEKAAGIYLVVNNDVATLVEKISQGYSGWFSTYDCVNTIATWTIIATSKNFENDIKGTNHTRKLNSSYFVTGPAFSGKTKFVIGEIFGFINNEENIDEILVVLPESKFDAEYNVLKNRAQNVKIVNYFDLELINSYLSNPKACVVLDSLTNYAEIANLTNPLDTPVFFICNQNKDLTQYKIDFRYVVLTKNAESIDIPTLYESYGSQFGSVENFTRLFSPVKHMIIDSRPCTDFEFVFY